MRESHLRRSPRHVQYLVSLVKKKLFADDEETGHS